MLQAMHTLKYYYWVSNPKDRSGIIPKGVGRCSNNTCRFLEKIYSRKYRIVVAVNAVVY